MTQSQAQSDLSTLVRTYYKGEDRLLGRQLSKGLSPEARGPELRSSALNKYPERAETIPGVKQARQTS